MKHSRLFPWLAAAAPFVMFGFIDVMAVQPQLALERDARARAASLGRELARAQALAPTTPVIHMVAQREFEELVPLEDRSSEVAGALRSLLRSSTGGSAGNLSIETGDVVRPTRDARESGITSFDGPIAYRPLTVTFDARIEQLTRFFVGLRGMPTIVELGGLEIAPAPSGRLVRTRLVLFVYQRSEAGATAVRAPAPQRVAALAGDARRLGPDAPRLAADGRRLAPDAPHLAPESVPEPASPEPKSGPKEGSASPAPSFEGDPVVHTILFSSQHRVALVDGRIVRPGDRIGPDRVQAIEQDAVILVTSTGLLKRLVLEQPELGAAKQ